MRRYHAAFEQYIAKQSAGTFLLGKCSDELLLGDGTQLQQRLPEVQIGFSAFRRMELAMKDLVDRVDGNGQRVDDVAKQRYAAHLLPLDSRLELLASDITVLDEHPSDAGLLFPGKLFWTHYSCSLHVRLREWLAG